MARRLLWWQAMEPIDSQELITVTGGFDLAGLAGLFTGIGSATTGIAGLVNTFKGLGSPPQTAQAQPTATTPTAAAPTSPGTAPASAPTQMASGTPSSSGGSGDMVTNIINIGNFRLA